MSTYSEAHKRYYEKNKEKIFWKTRKYKKAYNHERYLRLREELKAQKKASKQQKLQDAIVNQGENVIKTDATSSE